MYFQRGGFEKLHISGIVLDYMERPRKHPDREFTFLTQDEVKRLFAAIAVDMLAW